jgi:hypothetical protein
MPSKRPSNHLVIPWSTLWLILWAILSAALGFWVYERHLTLALVRAKLVDIKTELAATMSSADAWRVKAQMAMARSLA